MLNGFYPVHKVNKKKQTIGMRGMRGMCGMRRNKKMIKQNNRLKPHQFCKNDSLQESHEIGPYVV